MPIDTLHIHDGPDTGSSESLWIRGLITGSREHSQGFSLRGSWVTLCMHFKASLGKTFMLDIGALTAIYNCEMNLQMEGRKAFNPQYRYGFKVFNN